MDFKIHTDATESTKDRRKRPPNYASRAVRLRLATLVAMLGITAIAMNEAGKPESWEWLGFSSPVQLGLNGKANSDDPLLSPEPAGLDDADSPLDRFWSIQFKEMEIDERKLLLQIVEQAQQQEKFIGNGETARQLISRVVDDFKDLTQTDPSFDEKHVESFRDLTDGLKLWLTNHDQPDQQRLSQFQIQLDSFAYDLLEDRSSLGRSAESLAWTRSWNRLATAGWTTPPQNVTIVQLVGQPAAYRGKLVTVSGTAKGIERLKVADEELGFEHYHVLWVKPREMSRTPFCVYARTLPDGFPEASGKFQNIDESVVLNGIFFKLRSYVSTSQEIETCPLIVADSITWQPKQSVVAEASWRPPTWLLAIFFVALPLLAAWLAIGVYRDTKVVPIKTGQAEQQQIEASLQVIADDDSIKSDRQRVDELQQQLEDEDDLGP